MKNNEGKNIRLEALKIAKEKGDPIYDELLKRRKENDERDAEMLKNYGFLQELISYLSTEDNITNRIIVDKSIVNDIFRRIKNNEYMRNNSLFFDDIDFDEKTINSIMKYNKKEYTIFKLNALMDMEIGLKFNKILSELEETIKVVIIPIQDLNERRLPKYSASQKHLLINENIISIDSSYNIKELYYRGEYIDKTKPITFDKELEKVMLNIIKLRNNVNIELPYIDTDCVKEMFNNIDDFTSQWYKNNPLTVEELKKAQNEYDICSFNNILADLLDNKDKSKSFDFSRMINLYHQRKMKMERYKFPILFTSKDDVDYNVKMVIEKYPLISLSDIHYEVIDNETIISPLNFDPENEYVVFIPKEINKECREHFLNRLNLIKKYYPNLILYVVIQDLSRVPLMSLIDELNL